MKNITVLTGLLVAAGFSSAASAHMYNGVLGSAPNATDKFYITCYSSKTAKMVYRAKRTTGSSNISAKAYYRPVGAIVTSNGTTYSPLATVNTGAGAKFFEVKKAGTTSGLRAYSLNMHCWDVNNMKNPDDQPASVTYIQNQ